MLFFAAAMAVTAFPVMAAIITERGLLGTAVADLCLVCGCFSDFTAWSLLALVLAAMAGNFAPASMTLPGAVDLRRARGPGGAAAGAPAVRRLDGAPPGWATWC